MHNTHLTPTFSVITVCYNAGAVIEDTIQSVISQTYHHVEYIIIDGASTDKTYSIIHRYREHITRVVSEPDQGIYDAMNKGIALATGDYLCFLNAGDSFHEDDTLQQMVHTLRDTDELPDVLYGETQLVDREGHFVRMRRLSAPERLTWRSFRWGMLVCHQAFFAKRSLAEPYDLRYRFSADFDWCIRVMKKARTLHPTHLVLIDYLQEGMTTRNHQASLRERFRIMAHHYGWFSTLCVHVWFLLRAVLKK
ncbi:MAG: glycosyltransferase [Mediterranea sp.]|nr:glycosyltransferase [Mediterranea sp.]